MTIRSLAILAGIACLYVLIFGPAMSLANRGIIPKRAFVRVYRPLPVGFQQKLLNVWGRIDASSQSFQYSGPP